MTGTPLDQVTFTVPELHCEGCARSIRGALEKEPGVRATTVDVAGRRLGVTYDPSVADPAAIRQVLRRTGFEAAATGERGPQARKVGTPEAETPHAKVTAEEEPAREPPRPQTSGVRYALLALGIGILALAGYAGYELYPRFDLPAVEGAGLFLLAAGAGIASFFSPCAFPLLLTLLARETGAGARSGSRSGVALRRGLGFATALSLGAGAFLLLAGLIVALGGGALFEGVVFMSPEGRILRAVAGGFLVLLGLVQLGALPLPLHAVEKLATPLLRAQARERRRRVTLGFALFGFGYLLAGFG